MAAEYDIVLNFVNNTTRGMGKVESDLQKLQASGERVRRRMIALGAAIGAAAAGLTAITVNSARQAQELRNMASLAGVSTQRLQALGAATRTVGINQDQLADILKDVNDRVGEFLSTGGGPMADFFENIAPQVGVTAEEFRNLSSDQALGLYIRSLQDANLNQAEMTFYLEAIANDATALVPLFANQSAELQRLTGEYESLNIALSDTDLQTLNEAAQAVSLVGSAIAGLADQIAVAFAPAIIALSRGFIGLIQPGTVLRTIFDGLTNNIERLAIYAGTAATTFDGLTNNIERLAIYAGTAATLFAGRFAVAMGVTAVAGVIRLVTSLRLLRGALIRTGFGAIVVLIGELIYQLLEASEKVGGFGEMLIHAKNVAEEVWQRIQSGASLMGKAIAGVGMMIKAEFTATWASVLEEFSNLLLRLQGGINTIKGALNDAFTFEIPSNDITEAMGIAGRGMSGLGIEDSTFGDEFAGRAADIRSQADSMRDSYRAYMDRIRTGAGLLTRPLESVEALREAMAQTAEEAERVNEEIAGTGAGTPGTGNGEGAGTGGSGGGGAGGMAAAIDQAVEATQTWAEKLHEVSGQIGQGIGQALSDGVISFQEFRDIALQALGQIIQYWIQNSSIFQAPGGGLSSGGNFFSQLVGGLFGGFRDKGGMIGSGKVGIVGERGPEFVKGPAMVTSRTRTASMMNGGGGDVYAPVFNTTVNTSGGGDPEEGRKIAEQLNNAIEAKVADSLYKFQNRNNSYAAGRKY